MRLSSQLQWCWRGSQLHCFTFSNFSILFVNLCLRPKLRLVLSPTLLIVKCNFKPTSLSHHPLPTSTYLSCQKRPRPFNLLLIKLSAMVQCPKFPPPVYQLFRQTTLTEILNFISYFLTSILPWFSFLLPFGRSVWWFEPSNNIHRQPLDHARFFTCFAHSVVLMIYWKAACLSWWFIKLSPHIAALNFIKKIRKRCC